MSRSFWLDSVRRRLRRCSKPRHPANRQHRLPLTSAEFLESRCLPTVSAILIDSDSLIVTMGENDDVQVTADANGFVQITSGGATVDGFQPTLAADLADLTINGGDGANAIDVSGVTDGAGQFASSLVLIVNGGDGDDTILGGSLGESLNGDNGSDVIDAGDGANTVSGGDGADSITGGGDGDSLLGDDGQDTLVGNDGDDTIFGGNGADSIAGGDGVDSLNGNDGADTIRGDSGDDVINGEDGFDSLLGGDGNDAILGGAENDTVSGGDGDDTVSGNAGDDVITGEAGTDSLSGDDGADSLDGGDDNDSLNGGGGNDTVFGQDGNDNILGGVGNDLLFGDSNDPTRLGTGNDTVLGQGGSDTLNGGGGTDSLDGGIGNDLVQSGDFDSSTGIVITIANATNVVEGDSGTTTDAVFVVSLNRAASQIVTVQYTTADGSATTSSNDYSIAAGTLQFAPGQTTLSVSVPVNDDGLDEADENFFVLLSNSTVAVIGDTEAEAFIVDDDGWAAQGPSPATGGQTENVAPNNEVVGAVHVVLPHPTDPNILFVGGVNGGVWRTTNAQATSPTWTPVTDFQAAMSIGAMAFDPSNPNRLVAGIGRHSSFGFDGGDLPGLLVSNDLGTTWSLINDPLLQGKNNSAVMVRGNTLLFAADFNFGTGVGLFRSTDGGTTWASVSGGNGLAAGGVADLVRDPSNPSRLYATVLGQGLFRSDNEGATWVNVSVNDASANGLNATMTNGGNNNAEMGIATNGRVYVTAMVNGQAAYIGYSDNQGATWTAMDLPRTQESNGDIEGLQPRVQPGSQGIIHFSITVDPTNPNIVYVGGDRQDTPFPNAIGAVNFSGRLFRGDASVAPTGAVPSPQWAHLTHRDNVAATPTGGTANNSSPHADSRDMAFDAAGNLIEGDDGGVYRRTNPRSNTGDWFSINGNLQITEQHDLAYDPVTDILMSGNQDTGTTEQSVSGSLMWRSVSQGDGGDVAVDPLAIAGQSIRYSSFQNLGNFRGQIFNAANALQSTFVPALTVSGNGAALQVRFVTPVVTNSVVGDRLLIGGGNSLYESTNRGTGITEVGAGIVANNGNTIVYGGRQGGVANPELIYVAEGNQIFRRTAAGSTFTTLAFPGSFVVGLVADPNNFNNVYVADSTDAVWRSANGGTTWTNITGTLSDPQLRDIEYIVGQSGQPDAVVVGGRLGVYRMPLPTIGTWAELGASALPNTSIMEMQYSSSNDTLYVGTLGRGAWAFANVSLGEQLSTPAVGTGGLVDLTAQGDMLVGGDGNDTLIGADGNDTINGNAGFDSLLGGNGNDSILGGAANDVLDGGAGDDTLNGQSGNDSVVGGAGSDTFVWNGTGDGADTLSSLSGYDRVRVQGTGASSAYSVTQLNGQMRVSEGSASITISSVIQVVEINAGGGDDTITIEALDRVTTATLLVVNGDGGNDTVAVTGASIGKTRLQLNGGNGNDSLTGSGANDTIDGGDGDDRLDGGAGNDFINGSAGSDRILGGAGNDRINGGDGNDSVTAGAGDDIINGDAGADTINGELGNDTADGGAGADTLNGLDGHDSLSGGADADLLMGGSGNDTLNGGGSGDTLLGETGNDKLFGNDGNDSMLGGDGDDTLNGGDGDDTVLGELGADLVGGLQGNDIVNGGAGNDILTGGDGNDTLLGGAGNDVLLGDEGDDSINGQSQSDIIAGGEGNDSIADPASEIDETITLSSALLAALTTI